MTKFNNRFSGAHLRSRTSQLVLLTVVGLTIGSAASGQAFRSEVLGRTDRIEVRIEASSSETVRLLAGILEIRGDLQLGLLAKQAGQSAPHIVDARTIVWPQFREGLMAAGMSDIDPLLQALEEASEKEAIAAAFADVESALLKGRSAMHPTSADVLLSLHAVAKEVATTLINPASPTELHDYQDAWAMILAARGELDLLMRDPDPFIAKYATESAMAFDEVIIALPDPNQPGAVEVDAQLFQTLVQRLEQLDKEA